MIGPTTVDDAASWLDTVAAIDYLGATHRLGLTVWDALEEAIRWWTADSVDPPDSRPVAPISDLPWDDPDPLRSTLERLLRSAAPIGVADGHTMSAILTSALGAWVERMAVTYNDGHGFSSPAPRVGWPPPMLESSG